MVIITTRDTHRLATYSEKELGIGSVASDLFPQMPWVEWGLGQGEEGGRSGWPGLQVSGVLWGSCSVPHPPPLAPRSPGIFLQLHPQPG